MILSITKLLFLFVLLFFQFDSIGAHISSNSLSSQPKRYEKNSKWCKGPIDGDCNPYNCGGGCESKYIRFYDKAFKMDRTIKSCFCQQERLCSILGMHAFSGCKSYYQLSSVAQKFVRYWSMDRRDHKNRHSNSVRHRYSDKARHFQLLNGNSRFCCRATTQKRLALHLRSSGPSTNFYFFSSLIAVIYFLIY
ncbi:hypothetical protein CRE_25075 [Caenorhabditis remanei]|uniref:Uncharacterized protein n=1 Tax=Caenorhabditis remanei TaxID=31234 RepID=E3LSS4_CAERE|nr:hypothetical protein CRE_25075 [Caenorhabditis remanei]